MSQSTSLPARLYPRASARAPLPPRLGPRASARAPLPALLCPRAVTLTGWTPRFRNQLTNTRLNFLHV